MENETGPKHNYFLWRRGRFFTETPSQKVATIVFDIIGFTLSIGLVLMGYTYGRDASNRILAASQSKTTQNTKNTQSSQRPTPVLHRQDKAVDCPDGFQRISQNSVQLCLPTSFTNESSSKTTGQYGNGEEEFIISVGEHQQFPIDICRLERNIIVSTIPATRTIFRQETDGGCGDIVGFATDISDTFGQEVQLHLWKEHGTYGGEETYNTIEQSVKL